YPSEHGVRTNAASTYNKAVVGLPELLLPKRYMTFFLSGGPPVLRKSAISRGFSDFDDIFKPDNGFYLPANDVAEKFLNLYENRIEHTRFFGVLYFSDFLFPDGATKDKHLQDVDAALGKI